MRCVRGLLLISLHLELAACGDERPRRRDEEAPKADLDARDRRALVSHLNELARVRPSSPAEIAALDDHARPAPTAPPVSPESSASNGAAPPGRGGRGGSRPPGVRFGAVKVTGKLPPEVVQRVVRSSFGRVRHCYQAALGFDKLLEGEVTPTFTVGGDGDATLGSITSTMGDAELEACIGKTFDAMTFPSPEDGLPVSVIFPVKLAPPGYGSFFGQSTYAVVGAADVAKALADAGCTDVVDHGSVPGTDAVEITAKRSGRDVFVSFVPSTGAPVDPADVERLSRAGAMIRKGAFLVAIVIDGDLDRSAARELMDALVPAP